MKRFVCMLALLLLALPAWSAKKISVGELEDSLKAMLSEKKSDAEIANALKEVSLSERLTRTALNSLSPSRPVPPPTSSSTSSRRAAPFSRRPRKTFLPRPLPMPPPRRRSSIKPTPT